MNRPGWWSPQQALAVVFLRHGERASSDVAVPPGYLQWLVGPLTFISILTSCRTTVPHASPGNHLSEEGPGPLEGSSMALGDRQCSAAQEHLQEETSKVGNQPPVKNSSGSRAKV